MVRKVVMGVVSGAVLGVSLFRGNRLPVKAAPAPATHGVSGLAASPGGAPVPAVRERDGTRRDAWAMFERYARVSGAEAGGTGPNKAPAWERWSTKCVLHLNRYCPAALETTKQHPSDRAPGQFSTVYYNGPVAAWINRHRLYDSAGLMLQMKGRAVAGTPAGRLQIRRHAPDGAVVVKEIWEAVNPSDGVWTVKVYDPTDFPGQTTTLGEIRDWHRSVTLRGGAAVGADLDVTTPCGGAEVSRAHTQGPGSTGAVAPVPVNCFVYRYEQEQCTDLLSAGIPAAARPMFLNKPCLLVLVGVQMIARDHLENWRWSTFWWTADAQERAVDDADGRNPERLDPGFRNFAMDTMASRGGDPATQPAPAPLYNPYLEGIAQGGRRTNCLTCHANAAYVPQPVQPEKEYEGCRTAPGIAHRDGLSPVEILFPGRLEGPRNCTREQLADPRENKCALRTSFLWSLATNQDCESQTNLLEMVDLHGFELEAAPAGKAKRP